MMNSFVLLSLTHRHSYCSNGFRQGYDDVFAGNRDCYTKDGVLYEGNEIVSVSFYEWIYDLNLSLVVGDGKTQTTGMRVEYDLKVCHFHFVFSFRD